MNPKYNYQVKKIQILAASLFVAVSASAQQSVKEGDIYELNPFEVNAGSDTAYVGTQTMSATKIAVPLKDLPVSISVVTSELIEDMGALALEDTIKYTAGASLGGNRVTSGHNVGTYTVRGFSSGLALRNGSGSSFRFGDMSFVDRVEVVKGPTALYGESSPGGFVNVITKRPLDVNKNEVKFELGSFDHVRSSFDVNRVFGDEGKAKLRINGFYQDSKDEQDNIFKDTYGINPVFHYSLTPNTKLKAEVSYIDFDGISQRNPYPFTRDTREFIEVDRKFTLTNSSDSHVREDFAYEAGIEHSFGRNVHLQASFTHSDYSDRLVTTYNGAYASADPDGGMRAPRWPGYDVRDIQSDTASLNFYAKSEFEDWTNELIVSARTARTRGMLGNRIYFGDVTADYPQYSPTKNLADLNPNLFNVSREQILEYMPVPNIGFVEFDGNWGSNYGITERVSLLDNKFILLGGLRFVELVDSTEPAYQFGVTYKLDNGLNLFAGYNDAHRSNGQKDDGSDDYWDPIHSVALEAGVKISTKDNKLSGSFAVFDITQENIVNSGIFGAGSGSNTGESRRTQSGEQKSTGLELELYYMPSENWTTIFSYTNLDARVTKEDGVVTDGDGNLVLEDRSGRTLKGASKNALAVWTKYGFTDGSLEGWSFGGGYTWKQGPVTVFEDHSRGDLGQEDDFYEVDLFAQYETMIGEMPTTVSFHALNATDEYYMIARGELNQPQRYRLSVSMDF